MKKSYLMEHTKLTIYTFYKSNYIIFRLYNFPTTILDSLLNFLQRIRKKEFK